LKCESANGVNYFTEVGEGVGVCGEVSDRVVQHRMVGLKRERKRVEAAHDLFVVIITNL
jgi:hypothetical protein